MTAEEKAKVGPGFVFLFGGFCFFFLIEWLSGGVFVCFVFHEQCHIWVPEQIEY